MNPYESPKASLDRPKTPMERDIEEGAKQFYAEVRALFMMGVIMALHVTTIMDVQRLAFPLANIAVVAAVLGAVATSIAIVFQICRMILVLWIDDLPWKLDLFLWGVFERVKKAVTFFTIIVAVATAHEIVVGLGGGLVHLFLSACGVVLFCYHAIPFALDDR